jgi:hypothetical protein
MGAFTSKLAGGLCTTPFVIADVSLRSLRALQSARGRLSSVPRRGAPHEQVPAVSSPAARAMRPPSHGSFVTDTFPEATTSNGLRFHRVPFPNMVIPGSDGYGYAQWWVRCDSLSSMQRTS